MFSSSYVNEDSLSPYISLLVTFALTISYVGVLYISPKTRPSAITRRDDTDVVIHRLYVISIFTTANVLIIIPGLLLLFQVYSHWTSAWLSLGISLDINNLFIYPLHALITTMILYVGPLVELIWFNYQGSLQLVWQETKLSLKTVHGLRNYVIGPLTEELIFRGCVIGIYLSSNVSKNFMVFVTPLFFAVAHVHHFYEEYLHIGTHSQQSRGPRIQQLLLVTVLQFTYTTLFGWYIAYIFVATHSVWACVLIHIFCNCMGLPLLTLDTEKKTRVYRILLAVGIIGFCLALKVFPAKLGI